MNKLSILCLTAAGLSSCTGNKTIQLKNKDTGNNSTRQLNIVILLTDDQGYGDMKY